MYNMHNVLYNFLIKKTQKVVHHIVHFVQFFVQYFCEILYVFYILYVFTMLARPVQFPKYLTILYILLYGTGLQMYKVGTQATSDNLKS